MEKKSKVFQRKIREQPQQHHMSNPPILEEKRVEEEDFDKWRVINMQYQALFKKKNEISFEDRQISQFSVDLTEKKTLAKPQRTTDNKLDQRYLASKLLEVEQKQSEKVKRPALLIQSTEEILKQLPKGESLLEEAEITAAISRKIEKKNENPEEVLRNTVDSLHLKQVQRTEAKYIETYEELSAEIEFYEKKNAEFEQKIRKFSIQANSEHEEFEEIKKHSEKINELEKRKIELYKEILLMEETIALLQKDIQETISGHYSQNERLNETIAFFKEKVTQIDNQKVESLEYECKELYKENQELELEIEKIEKLWKGDHRDVKKIMEELDENMNAIRKEGRDLTVSRSIIAQKREKIRKNVQDLENERLAHLKSGEIVLEKNPRNLYIYLDNVLTDASRKIRKVLQGDSQKSENVVKSLFEKQFSGPNDSDDVSNLLKSTRDCLSSLKDSHDNQADFFEKEVKGKVSEIIKNCKGAEIKAISKSFESLSQISPIRKVSPARESSLASLSKLREITDKVIRPKHTRTPSNSSKGSVDLSEVESRKQQHKKYLKLGK